MNELQQKILEAFEGKVVRKDLAFLVKGNLPVPTFVLEYLLGQYCATDDQEAIEKGLDKVKKVISDNYVRREEAEEIKSRIREAGTYRIIDKVSCILNDRADHYEATFANLGLAGIAIADEIVVQNPKLLSGNGVWSIVNITYNTGSDAPSRWEIQTLKPIQISRVDVNDYVSKRQRFSSEEWMDFLVHTVGLNPEVLNEREKMIVLARLLPFVENNFNFMELGPKGTGKSHVFQELSPYGVLVSGGDVTSARLFSRISGSREYLGLVAYWDVVAWDEYEHQKGKKIDPVMIDTMQNYLANKSFNRGKATHEASASMVFVGNTKHTVDFMLRNSHLFESIPDQFIKGAFLDRIHCYNPGWEVKILKKNSFSKDYGLITDYIAAVLHELRSRDFSPMLDEYVKFDGSLSERDSLAIRKTFSGFVKLLYPDGNLTHEEAMKIVDFAGEGRKRVKDQLGIIDSTFRAEPAHFVYTIHKTGAEGHIETLEKINAGIPQNVKEQDLPKQTEGYSTAPTSAQKPKLEAKHVNIRMGQTGVSYQTLFADYLADAREIVVEDPFIRTFWQIRNFSEFLAMLVATHPNPEGLKVTLKTWEEDESKCAEHIDDFEDIKEDLASLGIDFNYIFEDFHDRCIKADNGWTIALGRGLDIFDQYGKFSIANVQQEKRKCKEFSVTYSNNRVDFKDAGRDAGNKGIHMKTLAIRQPWATLVAAGIKDVECRDNMVPPCKRFLITASTTRDAKRLEDVLPDDLLEEVNGYIQRGQLPPYEEWPTGAIVGYADIGQVTYDPVDSPWAYGHEGIKYVLKNAHMLDTPIYGKNKATPFFYNVDGYDEEHLPPAHVVKLKQ